MLHLLKSSLFLFVFISSVNWIDACPHPLPDSYHCPSQSSLDVLSQHFWVEPRLPLWCLLIEPARWFYPLLFVSDWIWCFFQDYQHDQRLTAGQSRRLCLKVENQRRESWAGDAGDGDDGTVSGYHIHSTQNHQISWKKRKVRDSEFFNKDFLFDHERDEVASADSVKLIEEFNLNSNSNMSNDGQ